MIHNSEYLQTKAGKARE